MALGSGWWFSSSEHVLTDQVPGSPSDVRDFYCDFRNVVRLHPLVLSIEVTGSTETEGAQSVTYRVRDRIPFGPLVVPVAYTAHVRVPTRGDVLTEASQFPGVRLTGRVTFEEFDGGTRVTERLVITAPRPLAAVTARKAVQSHSEMLAGIGRCFA